MFIVELQTIGFNNHGELGIRVPGACLAYCHNSVLNVKANRRSTINITESEQSCWNNLLLSRSFVTKDGWKEASCRPLDIRPLSRARTADIVTRPGGP